jgi:hypothetical protein
MVIIIIYKFLIGWPLYIRVLFGLVHTGSDGYWCGVTARWDLSSEILGHIWPSYYRVEITLVSSGYPSPVVYMWG